MIIFLLVLITTGCQAIFVDRVTVPTLSTCDISNCIWEWQQCSKTCGGGTQLLVKVKEEGKCGRCDVPRVRERQCSMFSCTPPGIVWGQWATWSECSATCGQGTQQRSRYCVGDGGRSCSGAQTMRRSCNEKPCRAVVPEIPQFVWSPWTSWSKCTVSCGGGEQTRMRECIYLNSNRQCIGTQNGRRSCNPQSCTAATEGTWGEWNSWSACTQRCGIRGQMYRIRVCNGLRCTGNIFDIKMCPENPCEPTVPYWGDWSEYGECSAKCGPGKKRRSRECIWPAGVDPNVPCPGGETEDFMNCNEGDCKVPYWDEWSKFGKCSVNCGDGTRSRYRTCILPNGSSGNCPPGENIDFQDCNDGDCPVPHWGAWSEYSDCSVTCGGGMKIQIRKCVYPPLSDHSLLCEGESTSLTPCNINACPEPYWDNWSVYGACSVTCGKGLNQRTRKCIRPIGSNPKQPCPPGKDFQTKDCDEGDCPVPYWKNWSAYGACSVTCGRGTKQRTRICIWPLGSNPKDSCPGDVGEESMDCNTEDCPLPYWDIWSEFSPCSATCGSGTTQRFRTCIWPTGSNPAETCPDGQNVQLRSCNDGKCPAYWGDWGEYSRCSAQCGDGTKTRIRVCVQPTGSDQNEPCPPGNDKETINCNEGDCPEPFWGDWTTYGDCSVTCGKGIKERTRQCIRPPFADPQAVCDGLGSETMECLGDTCTAPYWGDWSEWSDCKNEDGEGLQSRSRNCVYPEGTDENSKCPEGDQSELLACDLKSPCSVTCGRGVKYEILIDAGGLSYKKYFPCNVQPCPEESCEFPLQRRHELDTEYKCCSYNVSLECGRTAQYEGAHIPPAPISRFAPRILGGFAAIEGSAPWQVFIRTETDKLKTGVCGGTIISKRWILTAGHCIASLDSKPIRFKIKKMYVHYGKIFLPERDLAFTKTNVARAIPHPEYSFPKNDIALVKLKQVIPGWELKIRPACLPGGEDPLHDSTCFISGFGISNNKNPFYTPELQVANIEIFKHDVCKVGYKTSHRGPFVNENEHKLICAGTLESGQDSCAGDSGGPLVCQRKGSCDYYVAGVTSLGPTTCATRGVPGIYSRVTFYEAWIKKVMRV